MKKSIAIALIMVFFSGAWLIAEETVQTKDAKKSNSSANSDSKHQSNEQSNDGSKDAKDTGQQEDKEQKKKSKSQEDVKSATGKKEKEAKEGKTAKKEDAEKQKDKEASQKSDEKKGGESSKNVSQDKEGKKQEGEKAKTGKEEKGVEEGKNTKQKKETETKLFKKIKVVNQMPDHKVQVFLNEDVEGEKGIEIEIEKGQGEQELKSSDKGIDIKSLRLVIVDAQNRTVDSGKKAVTWTKDNKIEIKNILKETIQGDQIEALLEPEQGDKDTLLITLELVPMPDSTRDNMN